MKIKKYKIYLSIIFILNMFLHASQNNEVDKANQELKLYLTSLNEKKGIWEKNSRTTNFVNTLNNIGKKDQELYKKFIDDLEEKILKIKKGFSNNSQIDIKKTASYLKKRLWIRKHAVILALAGLSLIPLGTFLFPPTLRYSVPEELPFGVPRAPGFPTQVEKKIPLKWYDYFW